MANEHYVSNAVRRFIGDRSIDEKYCGTTQKDEKDMADQTEEEIKNN